MKTVIISEIAAKNAFDALGKIKNTDCETIADIAQALIPYQELMVAPLSREEALIKQIEAKQREIEKLEAKIEKLIPEKKDV